MTHAVACRRRRRTVVSLTLPAAVALLSFTPLSPAATTWTNPAGGSWSTASNWSPAIAPGMGTEAVFNLGASAPDFPSYPGYTVTLPDASSIFDFGSSVTLQTDKVTLAQPASNKPGINTISVANAASQSASLTLTGGTFSSYSSSIATAGTASLTVSPNTIFDTGIFSLYASGSGGTASLAAAGPNSFIQTGRLNLANGPGTASLSLTNGAVALGYSNFTATYPTFPINYQFITGFADLASNGGAAHVAVAGPGSTLAFSTWDVAAGPGSTATISLSAGAQAYLADLTLGSNGGSGSLSLDGPGTTLTAISNQRLNIGHGSIRVGTSTVRGTGSLSLSNAAALAAPLSSLNIGYSTGAGSLSLASGSSVSCGQADVGPFSTVTLGSDTTSPSTWTVASDLLIDRGSVTVNAGGQLLAHSLRIGISPSVGGGTLALHGGTVSLTGSADLFGGTLAGSGTLHALSLFSNATIAPDGTLSLDADLSLSPASLLSFDLASPTTYDRLTSLQTLTFGGTLSITLDPSFTPSLGDTFDLLDFATRDPSSTFSSLSLPPLPPGLTWDTSSLYTTGTLAVTVPEPSSLLAACGLALLPLRHRVMPPLTR